MRKTMISTPQQGERINRRVFHRNLLLAGSIPLAATLWAQSRRAEAHPQVQREVHDFTRRTVFEYTLPQAEQTHEIIKIPDKPLVLISQLSNSMLVKLWLDPDTEEVTDIESFPIGPSRDTMLHGLAVSQWYPGKIWLTLEGTHKILLVLVRSFRRCHIQFSLRAILKTTCSTLARMGPVRSCASTPGVRSARR
ncbi:MAG TPA: hypothetical protein VKR06_07585 [Ktedonosporobacter sp.]|nr:hypothetical protein [Ktedonosporobacter sp.]